MISAGLKSFLAVYFSILDFVLYFWLSNKQEIFQPCQLQNTTKIKPVYTLPERPVLYKDISLHFSTQQAQGTRLLSRGFLNRHFCYGNTSLLVGTLFRVESNAAKYSPLPVNALKENTGHGTDDFMRSQLPLQCFHKTQP